MKVQMMLSEDCRDRTPRVAEAKMALSVAGGNEL